MESRDDGDPGDSNEAAWFEIEAHQHEEEAAKEAFLEQALDDISRDNARWYLGSYGDAIERRVRECLRQADELRTLGYHAPAVTLSATAIEVTIRFMLLRPLVEGAFLSDEWAEVLAGRITSGRSAEDRKLLPDVLRVWGVDVTAVELTSGAKLWQSVTRAVWPKRNKIAHEGEAATDQEAAIAIECAYALLEQVVYTIAAKLGFTLAKTGKWHEIQRDSGTTGWSQRFNARDPFQGR